MIHRQQGKGQVYEAGSGKGSLEAKEEADHPSSELYHMGGARDPQADTGRGAR